MNGRGEKVGKRGGGGGSKRPIFARELKKKMIKC